jgi:beta-glucanase (GH16 family)
VKARLLAAGAALAATCGVLIWGFMPASGAGRTTAPGSDTGSLVRASSIASSAPPATSKMRLIFDPSFRGSRLDSKIWTTCFLWADPANGCTNLGNKETEWYLPSQVQLHDGVLDLVSQEITTEGINALHQPEAYPCRSGMVTSYNGFNFKYGYLEVSAKIPSGTGMWPALWLAASDKKWPPEIDLLEHWGAPKNPVLSTAFYFHPAPDGAGVADAHYKAALTPGWHTFAVSWTASYIAWYLDGRLIMTVTQHIPHQRMYFIANLATFTDAPCTGTLAIRSVKVWEWR